MNLLDLIELEAQLESWMDVAEEGGEQELASLLEQARAKVEKLLAPLDNIDRT